MKRHQLSCKYCGANIVIRCAPEELRYYLRCCPTCWENDEPGMARFNRMAERMSPEWAMAHYAPVEPGRCC